MHSQKLPRKFSTSMFLTRSTVILHTKMRKALMSLAPGASGTARAFAAPRYYYSITHQGGSSMTSASRLSKALVAAAFGLSSVAANAALFDSNFGSLIPGYAPNDDSTFPAISLPFSINYFGTTYNSIFINNNGNAT